VQHGAPDDDLTGQQVAPVILQLEAIGAQERPAARIDDREVVDFHPAEQPATGYATDPQLAMNAVCEPRDGEAPRPLLPPLRAREQQDQERGQQQPGRYAEGDVAGYPQRSRHVRTPVRSRSETEAGP
jgi:hypothetical protein